MTTVAQLVAYLSEQDPDKVVKIRHPEIGSDYDFDEAAVTSDAVVLDTWDDPASRKVSAGSK